MKLSKSFFNLSKEDKVNFLLAKYSCNEIATMLVEKLETPVVNYSKLRISQEDFDLHFRIIKPYSVKKK